MWSYIKSYIKSCVQSSVIGTRAWTTTRAATLVLSVMLTLVSALVGCERDQAPPWSRSYADSLIELSDLISPDRAQSSTRIALDTPPRGALTLALPSRKARRYTIEEPPAIDVRAFWELKSCKLGGIIAYRNSPLGRMMLPSQRLLYEARFIDAARRCQATGRAQTLIEQAVEAKRVTWDRRWWNAVWGGRALASYLSRAWPRSRPLRSANVSDEAAFKWLAARSPDSHTALQSRLEQTLSSLSRSVGGNAINQAADLLWLSRISVDTLRATLSHLHREPTSRHHTRDLKPICAALERVSRSYQALQPEVSARYQALSALVDAIAPIITRLLPPTPELGEFITWWLRGPDAPKPSALRELRDLSRAHARLLTELRREPRCARE